MQWFFNSHGNIKDGEAERFSDWFSCSVLGQYLPSPPPKINRSMYFTWAPLGRITQHVMTSGTKAVVLFFFFAHISASRQIQLTFITWPPQLWNLNTYILRERIIFILGPPHLISNLLKAIYCAVRFEPDHLLQCIGACVETLMEDAENSAVFHSEFHFEITNSKRHICVYIYMLEASQCL